jgi:hypothetical protein
VREDYAGSRERAVERSRCAICWAPSVGAGTLADRTPEGPETIPMCDEHHRQFAWALSRWYETVGPGGTS